MKEEQLSPSELPIKEIDLSRFDIRPEKETLKDEEFSSLVDSIKEIGVRVPIHIVEYKNTIEVLDGGRRLRAAKMAGLKTIRTILIQDVKVELDIRRDAIVDNELRKNLTMEQLGDALVKYYKCGGFDQFNAQKYVTQVWNRRTIADKRNTKVTNEFVTLCEQVGVPPWKQKEAMDWVLGTDEEIRKEAAPLARLDKKRLVLKQITEAKDKDTVKRVQKEMISALKDAKDTTRAFRKARAKQALDYAQEEIAEAEKHPKRTMSAEETAEAEEARAKDKLTPHRLMGVLNGGLSKTWEGLTRERYVPALIDTERELEYKHLKPTHEFRVNLANSIPKAERTLLGNWLMFIRLAIEDMESVLEKADKTAYDTRE